MAGARIRREVVGARKRALTEWEIDVMEAKARARLRTLPTCPVCGAYQTSGVLINVCASCGVQIGGSERSKDHDRRKAANRA